MSRREHLKWGSVGVTPLRYEGVADLKTSPSPYVLVAEFGRSTSKGVNINRGEPQKLADAGAPPPWDGRGG